MLVEGGIIGTGLMWMIFISFLLMGLRELREEPDPARRFYALGVMAACVSMIAIAFFSFPFHEIEHGGLMFTAMAILIVEMVQSRQARKESEEAIALGPAHGSESKGSKKKSKKDTHEHQVKQAKQVKEASFPKEFYITIWKRFSPAAYVPLIALTTFLMTWGVYTQIINFKSQYYVVMGIAALRRLDSSLPDDQRMKIAQMSADFFWRAYQLDPTNGRAEFFHGFALTKKQTYDDAVAGTEHLEEGQLLYPQSDTFYALAMGYETRRSLAGDKVTALDKQIEADEKSIATMADGDDKTQAEKHVADLKKQRDYFQADESRSLDKAIDSYATAARYYPVKVEYYKELIRLLEEEGRYDEIVYWANRAVVVYDWLLKAPQIRWELKLSLGKAYRALGTQAMKAGNEAQGLQLWSQAEQAFMECKKPSEKEPSATYYYQGYNELGQMYEALGELDLRKGDNAGATAEFEKARDMYVQTFERKDNVGSHVAAL